MITAQTLSLKVDSTHVHVRYEPNNNQLKSHRLITAVEQRPHSDNETKVPTAKTKNHKES